MVDSSQPTVAPADTRPEAISQEVPVRDHAFDGIQEYDNNLPRWWLMLFYATIIWSVAYVAWYHGGFGLLGPDKHKAEMAELAELRAKQGNGELTEEQLRSLSRQPERIAKGKALYMSTACFACHAMDGTGSVGPNLIDRWWIHGSTMTDIRRLIANGGQNGMTAFKDRLSGDDLTNLTIWIVDQNRQGEKPGKRATDPSREKEAPISY